MKYQSHDPRNKLIEQGWTKMTSLNIKENPRAMNPWVKKAQLEGREVQFNSDTEIVKEGQWEVWMSPMKLENPS
jgi:hypothetical protein